MAIEALGAQAWQLPAIDVTTVGSRLAQSSNDIVSRLNAHICEACCDMSGPFEVHLAISGIKRSTSCASPRKEPDELALRQKMLILISLKYCQESTFMELAFTLAGLLAIVLAPYMMLSSWGKSLFFKIKWLIFSAVVFCLAALWCVVYGPDKWLLIQAGVLIVVMTPVGLLSSGKA
jgi:hypothetical protein